MEKSAKRNATYHAFLNREGPKNLGELEWPAPKEGVLTGKKFLLTGVYDTIVREDLYELIKKCGGHVCSTLAKSLDILLVGRDAGPAKLEKAAQMELTQMSEEEFYNYLTNKITGDAVDDPRTVKAAKKQEVARKVTTTKATSKSKKASSKSKKAKEDDDDDDEEEEVSPKKMKVVEARATTDFNEDDLEGTF